MIKIGLISDTHSCWDIRYEEYFRECNQIWHAGDIGNISIIEKLSKICPVRAVYGNIDGTDIRNRFPLIDRWKCENVNILMKHIGGYPNKYDRSIKNELLKSPPKLFISGHSHILKVEYDKKLDLLHINPGAAGKEGWHRVRTLVRFEINDTDLQNLEIIELKS